MFFKELPRAIKPKRIMMHYIDAGVADGGADAVKYECNKCDYSEWFFYDKPPSRSTVFKGEPCPKCNPTKG